jgi:hypothetical protein
MAEYNDGGVRGSQRRVRRVRIGTMPVENGTHTIEHHRTTLRRLPHIPRLLFQLPNSTLLCRLACINEACRDLNDDFVDWRAELLLQQYFWSYSKTPSDFPLERNM